VNVGPKSAAALAQTWERILQEMHPEYGRIRVSVVEPEEPRSGRPVAVDGANAWADIAAAGSRRAEA